MRHDVSGTSLPCPRSWLQHAHAHPAAASPQTIYAASECACRENESAGSRSSPPIRFERSVRRLARTLVLLGPTGVHLHKRRRTIALTGLFDRIARGDVIILDGAMGTELQRRGVPMDRVAWSAMALETHPDVIRTIHEDYVRAGADIIITNSFGSSRHVLEAAVLGNMVAALNRRAVELAKEARERAGAGRDVAIAGSISSWIAEGEARNAPAAAAARASYSEQADLLAAAGVDLLMLEMMRD